MIRKLILYCCFCCAPLLLIGEDTLTEGTDDDSQLKKLFPAAALKINVTALSDITRHSLFFTVEKPIARKWTLEAGAGWFFGSLMGGPAHKGESMNGLRLRAGAKFHYYTGEGWSAYVGTEAMYNFLNHHTYRNVCRFGCQYEEIMLVNIHLHNAGIAIKGGIQPFFGPESRFFFDFYMGIGYRLIYLKENLPEDTESIREWRAPLVTGASRTPGIYHYPNLLLGFHFGYSFGKK